MPLSKQAKKILDIGLRFGYYRRESQHPAGARRLSDSPFPERTQYREENWSRPTECGPACLRRSSTWCLGVLAVLDLRPRRNHQVSSVGRFELSECPAVHRRC